MTDKERMETILKALLKGSFANAYAHFMYLKKKPKDYEYINNLFEKTSIALGNSGTGGELTEAKSNEMIFVLGYKYNYDKKRFVKVPTM